MPLLCCELTLSLTSREFDGCLHPPSTYGVAHGRNAEELIQDFGDRLKDLLQCETRIERAEGDPDELGKIEADFNDVCSAIRQACFSLGLERGVGSSETTVELDDQVWEVYCRVYAVNVEG